MTDLELDVNEITLLLQAAKNYRAKTEREIRAIKNKFGDAGVTRGREVRLKMLENICNDLEFVVKRARK